MSKHPIILIDASSMIHRVYHAATPFFNRNGIPLQIVHGVARMVLGVVNDFKSPYCAFITDEDRRSFRHDLFPEYKANRSDMPEDITIQIPILKEVISAFGIPIIGKLNYEADDLIATYAAGLSKLGYEVIIVSSDKDLMQLISENVTMYDHKYKKYYKDKDVLDKFGVSPNQIGDLLALVGDTADNVPGLKGVGVKTAASILKKYHSLETLFDIDDISDTLISTIHENRSQIELSRELVELQSSICDVAISDVTISLKDLASVKDALLRYGLKYLYQLYTESNMEQICSLTNNDANKIYAASRIEELYKQIKEYQHSYYNLGTSVITDREFDSLYQELELLESTYPELMKSDSPTQTTGIPATNNVIKHKSNMYSLDNVYGNTGIHNYLKHFEPDDVIVLEPKNDGHRIRLVYIDGLLTHAIRKGDRNSGENILKHAALIPSIPIKIETTETEFLVDGEIIITRENLNELNIRRIDRGLSPLESPRSAITGVLSNTKTVRSDLRLLNVIIHGSPTLEAKCNEYTEVRDKLKELNFIVNDAITFKVNDPSLAIEYWNTENEKYATKLEQNSPVDGVVLKLNDLTKCRKLGYTDRAPRFAKAWKFVEPMHYSTISNITYSVGRSARFTPVAELNPPVIIDGVTIKQVSLAYLGNMKSLRCGIGSVVEIIRAGGCIPHLKRVVDHHSDEYSIPKYCPDCNSELKQDPQHLVCTNKECSGVIIARLQYAVSRDVLNIKGLGGQTISRLYTSANIRDLVDLLDYFISPNVIDYEESKDLSESVFLKIVNQVSQIKDLASKKDKETTIKLLTALAVSSMTARVVQDILTYKNEQMKTVPVLESEDPLSTLYEILTSHAKLTSYGVSIRMAAVIVGELEDRKCELKKLLAWMR